MKDINDKTMTIHSLSSILGYLSTYAAALWIYMFDSINGQPNIVYTLLLINVILSFVCTVIQHYKGGMYNIVMLIFRIALFIFAVLFAWSYPIEDSGTRRLLSNILSSPILHLILLTMHVVILFITHKYYMIKRKEDTKLNNILSRSLKAKFKYLGIKE